MSIPKSSELAVSRRELLRMLGGGFGLYGYASLLGNSRLGASPLNRSTDPLAVKAPHFPARAKRVIFLFMNGGLSQVDTFDPKPRLTRHDGQPMPGGYVKTERKTGNLLRSPFRFKRYGQSGIEVSELFSETAAHIDDICVIRSMHTEVPNHPPGMFLMNCGHQQPGRPSLGSWLTYGLGTENRNLPGFMVLCPSGGPPTGGVPLWNSAFLPAVYPWYLVWMTPFLTARPVAPLAAWTLVAPLTYLVWTSHLAGRGWFVPGWVELVEYGLVAGCAAWVWYGGRRRPAAGARGAGRGGARRAVGAGSAPGSGGVGAGPIDKGAPAGRPSEREP